MENYIDDILNPDLEKKGLIKKESEEFEKMNSGDWKNDYFNDYPIARVLEFYPIEQPLQKTSSSDIIVYAADSIESDTDTYSQTKFYLTNDDEFILKINSKKENDSNKVYASLISSGNSINTDITLLYCSELDKYYIIDNANEVFIGNFQDSNYKSFVFSLLFPKNFITLIISEDIINSSEINGITKNDKLKVLNIIKENRNFIIKFKADEKINTAIFSNKSYTDFVKITDNTITIPESLPVNRSRIFIF